MNKSVLSCLSCFVLKNFIIHAIFRSVALWNLNRKVSRLLLNSLLWFLMSNIRYLGESAKPGTVPKEPGTTKKLQSCTFKGSGLPTESRKELESACGRFGRFNISLYFLLLMRPLVELHCTGWEKIN